MIPLNQVLECFDLLPLRWHVDDNRWLHPLAARVDETALSIEPDQIVFTPCSHIRVDELNLAAGGMIDLSAQVSTHGCSHGWCPLTIPTRGKVGPSRGRHRSLLRELGSGRCLCDISRRGARGSGGQWSQAAKRILVVIATFGWLALAEARPSEK